MRKVILWILGVFVVGVCVFFGAQFITKTGVFKIPGVVYYDESLNENEIAVFDSIFNEEIVLDKDVTISARNELVLPELNSNEFLYEIYVPVVNYYSVGGDLTVSTADELFTNCLDCNYKLIDVNNLDYNNRLLRINDEFYLDSFNTGAVFRILKLESEKYDEEILPLVADALTKEFPEKDTVLSFVQTGVTAFSRLMNEKMNEVDSGAYFAEYLAPFLSKYDLVHTSSEASFSDWAPTSGATGTPICSDWRFTDTFKTIGLDIIELTGNHNLDCGVDPAIESIDWYNDNDIKIVGGGKNATEASAPLTINQKGTGITMLAFNESTGGATLGDYPGANQYYDDVAAAQIAEAKARGDIVIVDVQYYECSAYVDDGEDSTCDYAWSSPGDQVGFFRSLIDMGADIVVGTSAHQPQTFELYDDGAIYYGLGNLFFDQYRWPGTTRSLILVHHFYDGKLLQTEIRPTFYDRTFQTRLMDEETAEWYLNRLISERP